MPMGASPCSLSGGLRMDAIVNSSERPVLSERVLAPTTIEEDNVTPVSPVIPGKELKETLFAQGQPEYINLPAILDGSPKGMVTTRWRLTWRERFHLFLRGDLWLQMLTFRNPLHPVKLTTKVPKLGGNDRCIL